MNYLRKSNERGHANYGWLNTYHTFSFSDYYDPSHMGFRDLRVINDDTVAGGAGFPFHAHKDMEIITYVISGELEHQDTLDNREVLRPFEVQRMSAGSGIKHSEYNPSKDTPVHLLQIWILTQKEGVQPSYEQKSFKDKILSQKLTLVVSPNGENGSLSINQDVRTYVGNLKADQSETFELASGRHAWVQVTKGELQVNKATLKPGDGLGVSNEKLLNLKANKDAEFLLFDLR